MAISTRTLDKSSAPMSLSNGGTIALSNDPSRGGILLEILLVCALGGIAVTALVHATARYPSTVRIQSEEIEHATRTLRARSELHRHLTPITSHPFADQVRIHRGSITLRDGTLNEVMGSAPGVRPDPESDSITTIALDLSHALFVDEIVRHHTGYRSIACPLNPLPPPLPPDPRAFLGLSTEKAIEFSLLDAQRDATGCFIHDLLATPGMIGSGGDEHEVAFMHLLIPIVENATLYLSESGELRRLVHLGSRNIENQPVLADVTSLRCAQKNFGPALLPGVACTLALSGSVPLQETTLFTLGRRTLHNLLLNRLQQVLPP